MMYLLITLFLALFSVHSTIVLSFSFSFICNNVYRKITGIK